MQRVRAKVCWYGSVGSSWKSVIDGLTSVNASNYTDTFSVSPRVLDVTGIISSLELEDRPHFLGIISCQFTAVV